MLFWQKKEVLVTFSLNDFNRVKDILAANHIPYDWKTVPSWPPGPQDAGDCIYG